MGGSGAVKYSTGYRVGLIFIFLFLGGFGYFGYSRTVVSNLFKYESLYPIFIVMSLSLILSLVAHIMKHRIMGYITVFCSSLCGLACIGLTSYSIYLDIGDQIGVTQVVNLLSYALTIILGILQITFSIYACRWTRSLSRLQIFPVEIYLPTSIQDQKKYGDNNQVVHPSDSTIKPSNQENNKNIISNIESRDPNKPLKENEIGEIIEIPLISKNAEPYVVPIDQAKPDEIYSRDLELINTPFFIYNEKTPINLYLYSPNIKKLITPILKYINGPARM